MKVPSQFQPTIKVAYPNGNKPIFEEWFSGWYAEESPTREYLPINWTSYYVNNKYGNDKNALLKLEHYLQGLKRSTKYFTVLQYDDGILNYIDHLNIKVFGSGGGRIDVPIPLVCHPHGRQENKRDIFVSFIGSLTHSIRNEMILKAGKITGSYISTEHHDINKFCNILSRSTFALCPRGYGKSSFRICEALEQGAVPIYLSDDFIIPFDVDFESYGVLVNSSDIEHLDEILRSIKPSELESKRKQGRFVYENYFTFQGCADEIKRRI